MANCNCNDFPISCAPHAPGGDCCHPHGCPPHPCPPPPFKGGTSMYIGARYVPVFADPVEWDDVREYEPLTIVVHNGDCYTSKCYVPKGAQLPPYPEGQTKYWVKTSDYNWQFADLKKTVLDLSRLVEQFQKDNEHFTELINGWNEKVIQWEKDMTAWGERLDTVESNIADLTAKLNAEIDRAKAAEQANVAAIAQETADRKQAISELDAAYKAADAAEAQARAEANNALSNRITTNKTDIDAIKAEQVIQNTNISANAKNISDNSAEIAKHAKRLTDLESNASDWDSAFPDTTIAQEMKKEQAARANADTALNGRCDTIAADVEEVRDIANHKVDQTVFAEADTLNVKFTTSKKAKISAGNLMQGIVTDGDYVMLLNSQRAEIAPCLKSDFKNAFGITAAQAAADNANTNIGDWETAHPNQTISECATSLENETAANAAKADANAANIGDWNTQHPGKTISQAVSENTTALDDKANKSDIPDVSGFVTTDTYTAGQAAQDAKITAAQTAADKANTNIGDWNTQHPDKTIAQEVTRLSGAIPDVSGFVTETTYNQGQAAQDTKITEAKAAADKANTNIGDWNTQHPDKTIAQEVTDIRTDIAGIGYLKFLDKLYPENSIIPGGFFDSNSIYPIFYYDGSSIGFFNIPIFVPYVVSHFEICWNLVSELPTSISLYDNTGTIVETKPVTGCQILDQNDSPRLDIGFDTPFTISTSGIYYFKFGPTTRFKYSWTKNNMKFENAD
nr:MAG TPA: nuclear pore complex protein [Caudoviricetes sp.]